MAKPLLFVGIDVAQATLEVAVRPTGEAGQVANDEMVFGDLVERSRTSGRIRKGSGCASPFERLCPPVLERRDLGALELGAP